MRFKPMADFAWPPNLHWRLLVRFLQIVHFLILSFVLLGWLFDNVYVRLVHIILLPGLILHWRANGGSCFLTQLEDRWRTRYRQVPLKANGFTQSLLGSLGIQLGPEATAKVIYCAMTLSWLLSVALVVWHWS